MQITEVTDKAIQLRHPREVFFDKFPWPVVCGTCDSRLVLDNPEEVKYNTGSYGYKWLSFRCPLCDHATNLTDITSDRTSDDAILIRGYREYFPPKTLSENVTRVKWWLNWIPVAIVALVCMIVLISAITS